MKGRNHVEKMPSLYAGCEYEFDALDASKCYGEFA
jgi:hypothetical protein